MSTEKQPEALQLADEIDACKAEGFVSPVPAELRRQHARIAELEAQLEAAGAGKEEPFGYVNTYTGQFFWTVEACPKGNEAHWRTVYTHPRQPKEGSAACILGTQRKPA